jgi:hypothetical protein
MILFIIFLLLALLLMQKREPFKVELKTDFGSFDGLNNVASALSNHVKRTNDAMWDVMPFRPQIRALQRRMRKMSRS